LAGSLLGIALSWNAFLSASTVSPSNTHPKALDRRIAISAEIPKRPFRSAESGWGGSMGIKGIDIHGPGHGPLT